MKLSLSVFGTIRFKPAAPGLNYHFNIDKIILVNCYYWRIFQPVFFDNLSGKTQSCFFSSNFEPNSLEHLFGLTIFILACFNRPSRIRFPPEKSLPQPETKQIDLDFWNLEDLEGRQAGWMLFWLPWTTGLTLHRVEK